MNNSGKGPHLFQKGYALSAHWEGPDTGPTVCQGLGDRPNEIPCTWHRGRVGFLLSSKYSVRHYLPLHGELEAIYLLFYLLFIYFIYLFI